MNSPKGADIVLLLEGTYPYVRGGVAGWIHQIITGLPQFTFLLVFIGSKKDDYGDVKYEVPENVVGIRRYFIWDGIDVGTPMQRPGRQSYNDKAEKLHDWLRCPSEPLSEPIFEEILVGMGRESGATLEDFLFSEASWQSICDRYERYAKDQSFIDYMWAIRAMHIPLYKLAAAAHEIKVGGLIHTISTGYAGFLGAILSKSAGKTLILTEHGIYTKERKIDLQSLYMKEQRDLLGSPLRVGMHYQEKIWINFFESLGRITYRCSSKIISLYEDNRIRQVIDGAEEKRTMVIPNGIDVARFSEVRNSRPEEIPRVLGLLGRVVPIKDIKTFIRAVRIVVNKLPEIQAWIIGPEDEDPAYALECCQLVKNLGLDDNITFKGFQNIFDVLPQMGLMVLTSISEAFPLVILEAYASGLPVVTTDVGACSEIIYGRSDEDPKLGSAGEVVPIADPEATARAVISLMSDNQAWQAAQKAGIERLKRYYTQNSLLDRYTSIYEAELV
jgi:glycosyltransferase involved in cell wall biosynthesis